MKAFNKSAKRKHTTISNRYRLPKEAKRTSVHHHLAYGVKEINNRPRYVFA